MDWTMLLNCWEHKQCGRQPGGPKIVELGVCPAATDARVDGVNHGRNAGRCCWAVAGTLCKGEKQGVFAEKLINCQSCDFYHQQARHLYRHRVQKKFRGETPSTVGHVLEARNLTRGCACSYVLKDINAADVSWAIRK